MKLSELTTERAADVLCELTPYISAIIEDEDTLAALAGVAGLGQSSSLAEKIAVFCAKINKIVPVLLKKRREDMFGILAVLNEKTPDEIAAQNILVTMSQVRDLTKDRELLDFFKSSARSGGGA